MKRLMEEYDNYALSISVTTRDPRPGEEDGVSYFFRTEEEFDRMVEEDAFLEYARYVKHSYGTPKAYVEEQLDAGKDVLLEIEIQGALQVKEKRPDTLLVFITPPTAEELERRLRGRGTETEEVIKGRQAPKVEIDYTLKKNLRKPNGSKPGFVVYYTNYSMMAEPNIRNLQEVQD